MTNEQTISWIFLATALASNNGHANLNAIANAADFINHAIPSQDELHTSMAWLTSKGFVINNGSTYSMTSKGKTDYEEASKKTPTLSNVWENLEKIVKKYNT